MAEIGFQEHLLRTFGSRWAICRNTEHNRLRWGRCVSHAQYTEARDTWKRENPTVAATEAHWG